MWILFKESKHNTIITHKIKTKTINVTDHMVGIHVWVWLRKLFRKQTWHISVTVCWVKKKKDWNYSQVSGIGTQKNSGITE